MDFVSSIKAGPIEWLNVGRLDDRLIKEAAEWGTYRVSIACQIGGKKW